tara:strand:- start:393 stop:983 length:591 start_codon:yes stop_codon:yes gene_type:complete
VNNVTITLSAPLRAILIANNINPNNYKPAYDGESIGLDLYNTGSRIPIKPIGNRSNSNDKILAYCLRKQDMLLERLTWSDLPLTWRTNKAKILMPTGIRAIIPPGYGGFIEERGSITKTPLKIRAGVIDPGYTGEIFVNMINTSSLPFYLEAGAKSPFQLVIKKVTTSFNIVSDIEFERLSTNSNRKENKIGSSDQ